MILDDFFAGHAWQTGKGAGENATEFQTIIE
jgi:hypothetical protein